jgi:hypothetical protein
MEESQHQPIDDVLDLWNNLPASAKGISIAGIVFYIFTFMVAAACSATLPWYVTVGLFIWPLIIVVWLLIIWTVFVIFSIANVLLGKKRAQEDPRKSFTKVIVFVPTVIGTALTVVDVFFNDIFSTPEE